MLNFFGSSCQAKLCWKGEFAGGPGSFDCTQSARSKGADCHPQHCARFLVARALRPHRIIQTPSFSYREQVNTDRFIELTANKVRRRLDIHFCEGPTGMPCCVDTPASRPEPLDKSGHDEAESPADAAVPWTTPGPLLPGLAPDRASLHEQRLVSKSASVRRHDAIWPTSSRRDDPS